MKINYTTGRTYDSVTIDGKNIIDLPMGISKEAIIKDIEHINDIGIIQDILMLIAESGKYEDLGRCEQCGDYILSYTLNL